jgi:endonuclease YncB( thermonuclease family)
MTRPNQSSHTGFSALTPSCYDGDTSNLEDFSYGKQKLPDLFSKMNVRLLVVDAPEMRSVTCESERCPAELAKRKLKEIVVLANCRHDKHGGRTTCDIITKHGYSAAEEIQRTGLAVPYTGKRKTHSWCDLPDVLPEVEDPLYQHLL